MDLDRRACCRKPTADDRRAALSGAVARRAIASASPASRTPAASLDEMALYDAGAGRRRSDACARTSRRAACRGITEADADAMDAAWKRYGDDPTRAHRHREDVRRRRDREQDGGDAGALRRQRAAPARRTVGADELNRIVAMFDKRGWQIQIHAIGDRAIRMSLDAFEQAATVNPAPARGRRHRLEHIEAIAAADIPRFGRSA